MPHTAQPPRAAFVMPAWWRDPAFSLREISEFLNVPSVTLDHWFAIARITGHDAGKRKGSRRRFYSCHDVYIVALLAKLRDIGFPASDRAIAAAYEFATDEHGRPVAPATNGVWRVDHGTEGVHFAVQAWLAWVAVRAFATPHFGTAHV
mgnify:CR=1 FL=1